MYQNLKIYLVFILAVLFLCECNALKEETRDIPKIDSSFSKIAIIGVSTKLEERKFFEQSFASQLQVRGIESVESTAVFSNDSISSDSLIHFIKANNADAILSVSVIKKSESDYLDVMPKDYSQLSKFYSGRQYRLYTPGYYSLPEKYLIVATLHEAQTDSLPIVWKGYRVIRNPLHNIEDKTSFIQVVVEKLTKARLIE